METNSKTKAFAKACLAIREQGIANRIELKLKGKGKEKTVTLKGQYSDIAASYFGFEIKGKRRVFSWNQVTEACKAANIYYTDVVSQILN